MVKSYYYYYYMVKSNLSLLCDNGVEKVGKAGQQRLLCPLVLCLVLKHLQKSSIRILYLCIQTVFKTVASKVGDFPSI